MVIQIGALTGMNNSQGMSSSPVNSAISPGSERFVRTVFSTLAIALAVLFAPPAKAQNFTCTPPSPNQIVCENSLPGNPPSDWAIEGDGDLTIQGFATDISVNQGGTVSFKINTDAKTYTIGIFRLGYYAGLGARKIATISPSATLPQTQPACKTDAATNLYDCGNWGVSASWQVPANATSGIYFAVLNRPDTGGANQVFFIVRNDTSHSDILFQTSDETWQAYNSYGGHSVYGPLNSFDLFNRAYKVSYNRPFITRGFSNESASFVFGSEYAMIRWLEANGYDVTYFTGIDAARSGSLIQNHKIYMDTGHDEYVSGPQRNSIEAARDAGVNLAFFSGNEFFWKTRWENSIDGTNTAYRTMVVYKETLAFAKIDPDDPPTWTGTWRDPSFSPPADGGRPENALTGTIFMVNGTGTDNPGNFSIQVPAADGKMRFWRNTTIANLASGQTATLPPGTLGYEWDEDLDNGARPAGQFDLSTATDNLTVDFLLDYGATYGAGTATHHMTMHRAPSGALVFGAGTVQWAWGLDSNHDNNFGFPTPAPNTDMQQATLNLFADMGVQPASIQAGLLLATKSTDTTPPLSTITSPTNGSQVRVGTSVNITGTAADAGGGVVGGVEISLDGGNTWHPAAGRENWTYAWTPTVSGNYTIRTRATDDSGNIEVPSAGVTIAASTSAQTLISLTLSSSSVTAGKTVQGTVMLGQPAASGGVVVTLSSTNASVASVLSSVTVPAGQFSANFTVTSFAVAFPTSVTISGVFVATSNVTLTVTAPLPPPAGTIAVDAFAPKDQATAATSVTSSAFSTSVGSELILALVGTDALSTGATVTTITGAGLTWNLVLRANTQLGTSEIWRAFAPNPLSNVSVTATLSQNVASSMLVMSVAGVDTSGTNGSGAIGATAGANGASGAPTASLTTTRNKSMVLGVGNDWDNAIARVVGPNQTILHQDILTPGNTFWMQMQSAPIPLSGTAVAINDTAPTGDRYNLAIVEVLPFTAPPPPTYSISGTVSGAVVSGVAVTLGGASTASATTDTSGNYSFTGLSNGGYTVTPSKAGFTFTPTSQPATINNANVSPLNFTSSAVPTYTISGTVSGAVASGVTVNLTGTSSGTTTTDSLGNYSFTGLSNGGYTVTPSKAGFTFTPASLPATINNANVSPINFTSAAVPTYTISGTVSGAVASGVTVNLTGTSSGTATTDGSGNYSFTGLSNGSYTIVPSKSGFTFTPASQSATVNNANPPSVNFTSQVVVAPPTPVIDAKVSTNGVKASTIASPAFSTISANELLLAFVATDYLTGANTTVTGVSGGGLTWALVVRSNAQSGSSEIWRAFAAAPLSNVTVTATLSQSVVSSITMMSFSGIDTSGTNGSGAIGATKPASAVSGAPTASLTTTRNYSWVFGVGNDYDNATARVPGAGQSMVNQFLTPAGDTYWMQMQNSPTPVSGTSVSISDTAPTGDRYNLAIVEVLPTTAPPPPTYSISGTVSGAIVSGVTISLTGTSTGTATTDTSGNYSFIGLSNGTYALAPSKTGYSFTPANQPVTVSGASVPGQNFTSTAIPTFSVSGSVSGAVVSGVTMSLSGTSTASTTTDGSGNFTFPGLANGPYTVTPSDSGFTFTPSSQGVTVSGTNITGVTFTATVAPTWTISGNITPTSLAAGATVKLSGAASGNAIVDSSGNYNFTNLQSGIYQLTPAMTGVTFTPASQTVSVTVGNAGGINFSAQTATATAALAVDVNVSKDGTQGSTIASPAFSTKAGNELLLAFITTDYLGGANTTVTGVSGAGLTWALAIRSNGQSGTSEVWRAFAPAALSNATVTATISQSVVSAMTVLSFTGADATGTNGSGAIGATKASSAVSGAPTGSVVTTRNNSWVLGVGNDFDNAIARTAGSTQTLLHQLLTSTGDTYWVQMQNAVTPTSGTTVTINDTAPTTDRYNLAVVEVLPGTVTTGTPPTVTMTSPAPSGTVATLATVSANVADANYAITGVQFLLDGSNLGSQVTAAPYSLTWDSSAVVAGTHTLSAIASNSAGMNATASPVSITVDHSGNTAVVGSWSSVINLPTVAMNLILLKNGKLMFYEDGGSAAVWDYTNNVFTSVPTSVNLFLFWICPLADGRVLVVGGYGGTSNTIGIANAEIFDPSNNSWTTVPNMSYRRWYPTATTLSDGRILVTAGWQTTNHTNAGIPEIYDPSTNLWTKLTNANNPFETYPFMFVLQDGRIIHVGGTEYATNTDILNVSTQSWSVVDSRIIDGGAASMYLPGKIMKAGSATDSQGTGTSANTTFVLDTTQPTPTWQQAPSMAYPRSFLNLTELPDGSVLATGGETDKNGGTISNAIYAAELWSPQTQTWTTMSSMKTPREYHSTALLLPDARVLVSGMGFDFGQVTDETNAEIFSPPYLFKGARPTISSAPAQIPYGTNFSVTTPDYASISKVVLIRTGATTHFFDQNTRYVPLAFQQTTGGLTVTGPVDGNLAPPGYYMLFLVNGSGVPSVASIVQVP